ncbi:MAG: FAD/NAD(P)-binding protein [bacterium]|nr:FAD/NAD(P)-binding protein [bacterium]
MENIYLPKTAKIIGIKDEGLDLKTFTFSFINSEVKEAFSYKPGQFLELSIFGVGEVPISLSSSQIEKGSFQLTIYAIGEVTRSLHKMKVGDVVGIRGPFGNGFPFDEAKGKDILFVGGGIGMAPLRPLIKDMIDNRSDFGHIIILHGARTPRYIIFRDELKEWGKVEGVEVHMTVNRVDGEKWDGEIGLITRLFDKIEINPRNSVAFVCGPLFMIHIVVEDYLLKMGFQEEAIISTLERHMKCGVGHCGHCNVGPKYICIDGPVFTYREMKILPKEF